LINLFKACVVYPRTPGTHVPALDGIRGIAILLVMFCHFTLYGGMQPACTLDKLYYRVALAGWVGVDLFFVLSGYLITGILLDTKGGEYFFRNFYTRRALRIFPLYYGFLLLFFVIFPLTMPTSESLRLLHRDQGWYWGYLANVLIAFEGWTPVPGTVGHLWSLAVEEQFYLIWPVVIFMFRRRNLKIICLTLIPISLGVRVGLSLAGNPTAAYVLTPARMDALAVGAFLALAAREPSGLANVLRFVWPVIAGSSVSLASILIWRGALRPESMAVQTIGYTSIAFLCGALLTLAATSTPETKIGRILSHPILVSFGYYSYALYIFHLPITSFLEQQVLSVGALPTVMGSLLPAQAVFTMVATVTAFAIAFLSWLLYEVQFLNLKGLFPYRPKIYIAEKEQCEVSRASST
jgi:peptidoglycan/LPS O-acetylase OafA/YrhL